MTLTDINGLPETQAFNLLRAKYNFSNADIDYFFSHMKEDGSAPDTLTELQAFYAVAGKYNITVPDVNWFVTIVTDDDVPVYPTSLTITEPVSLVLGEKAKIKVTFLPPNTNKRTLTYASSDVTIATVNASGEINPLAAGSVTITVTGLADPDGTLPAPTATKLLTVTPKPETVGLTDAGAFSLEAGETKQLSVVVYDKNGQPIVGAGVSWTSSNATIATVDSTGLVTAVKKGNATITATTQNGKKTSVAVTITGPVYNFYGMFIDTPTLNVADLDADYITGYDYTSTRGLKIGPLDERPAEEDLFFPQLDSNYDTGIPVFAYPKVWGSLEAGTVEIWQFNPISNVWQHDTDPTYYFVKTGEVIIGSKDYNVYVHCDVDVAPSVVPLVRSATSYPIKIKFV
jgi:hypothetical protein